MNPTWWITLAITPTEDVRSIKRAYAARLKSCRPEEDPHGFAQLREAYDGLLLALTRTAANQAVSIVKTFERPDASLSPISPSSESQRTQFDSHSAETALPPPIVTPRPIFSDSHLSRDSSSLRSPHEVAGKILEEARRRSNQPSPFAFWLQNREELIALDFKTATSHVLLKRIADEGDVVRDIVDILSDFFSWADYRNRESGYAAMLSVIQQRLATEDFRSWLDNKRYKMDGAHRTLNRIRKFGDGNRAWLWATYLKNRSHVAQSFRSSSQRYGEPAVTEVVGQRAIAFWRRALAPGPTMLQLSLAAPVTLLMACLFIVIVLTDAADSSALLIVLWPVTALVAVLFLMEAVTLTRAFWIRRALPFIQPSLHDWAESLRFQSVPKEITGTVALGSLALIGSAWPISFVQWPFFVFVLFLSFPIFKKRGMIFGCGFATFTATLFVMQSLKLQSLRLPVIIAPATLWSGRQLHRRAHGFFPKMRATPEDFVAFAGAAFGLLFVGLMIFFAR